MLISHKKILRKEARSTAQMRFNPFRLNIVTFLILIFVSYIYFFTKIQLTQLRNVDVTVVNIHIASKYYIVSS